MLPVVVQSHRQQWHIEQVHHRPSHRLHLRAPLRAFHPHQIILLHHPPHQEQLQQHLPRHHHHGHRQVKVLCTKEVAQVVVKLDQFSHRQINLRVVLAALVQLLLFSPFDRHRQDFHQGLRV